MPKQRKTTKRCLHAKSVTGSSKNPIQNAHIVELSSKMKKRKKSFNKLARVHLVPLALDLQVLLALGHLGQRKVDLPDLPKVDLPDLPKVDLPGQRKADLPGQRKADLLGQRKEDHLDLPEVALRKADPLKADLRKEDHPVADLQREGLPDQRKADLLGQRKADLLGRSVALQSDEAFK